MTAKVSEVILQTFSRTFSAKFTEFEGLGKNEK